MKVPSPKQHSLMKGIINESFVYFKGYQFFCFQGALMWIFLPPGIFFFLLSVINLNTGGIIGYLLFTVFWFWLFQRRLYYFGVSDTCLVVKLHNVYWFNEVHQLADIEEVVLDRPYQMPICLRVTTKSGEVALYAAATLSDRTWLELKAELKRKGVKIRNEEFSWVKSPRYLPR